MPAPALPSAYTVPPLMVMKLPSQPPPPPIPAEYSPPTAVTFPPFISIYRKLLPPSQLPIPAAELSPVALTVPELMRR